MIRDFTTTKCNSFTLSYANCAEKGYNCHFPNEVIINNTDEFSKVCLYDHVLGVYKDNYRSSSNFISADSLGMDCDNDHSDNPKDWKTPEDVKKAFPGVPFYVSYSRNNNKVKKNKTARPRFHIIFLIDTVTDSSIYSSLKKQTLNLFPYFDSNAVDVARLFFGANNNKVEFIQGDITLNKYLENYEEPYFNIEREIPEGQRNATLHQFALKVVKRYGDSEKAFSAYLDESNRCNPPLDESELNSIWNSATRYYHNTITTQEDYVEPDKYDNENINTLKPDDFSDAGQAKVLARVFKNELVYTDGAGYLRYNGIIWEECEQRAQAAVQELTELQLEEAIAMMGSSSKSLEVNGATDLILRYGDKRSQEIFNKPQKSSSDDF